MLRGIFGLHPKVKSQIEEDDNEEGEVYIY
jgi:hypothetical protein